MSVAEVSFWSAFLIDIAVVAFAFLHVLKRMGGQGLLHRTTLFLALSAFVFGVHHVLEILLENVPNGGAIAEGVEGIAAVLLGIAVFQLYSLTRE